MKTSVKVLGFAAVSVLLASCGSSKVANYLEAFTPEESGLNLVKLTDESTNSIISGNSTKEPALANRAYYKNSSWAYSAEAHFKWCPLRTLAISPDGSKLAYLYKANGQTNIMVRNAGAQGAATQRTFRDVLSFSWAKDNKLYFSDQNGVNYYISSVNADQGSMMQQITNGSGRIGILPHSTVRRYSSHASRLMVRRYGRSTERTAHSHRALPATTFALSLMTRKLSTASETLLPDAARYGISIILKVRKHLSLPMRNVVSPTLLFRPTASGSQLKATLHRLSTTL